MVRDPYPDFFVPPVAAEAKREPSFLRRELGRQVDTLGFLGSLVLVRLVWVDLLGQGLGGYGSVMRWLGGA